MEEWVGQQWHHWLSRREATEYEDAAVALKDIRAALKALLVSLGGSANLGLQSAWPIRFAHTGGSRWRLTDYGTHTLALIDHESLYLPPQVNCFPDARLNLDLYYWWVAMAAVWPSVPQHWYQQNQIAMQRVFTQLPGLARRWPKIRQALLAERPSLHALSTVDRTNEQIVRAILQQSEPQFNHLAHARRFPYPIRLWLYPSPTVEESVPAMAETEDNRDEETHAETQSIEGKKSARRVSEQDEKSGLLLFRLENLFTVSDWLNVQRPQEDDEDASNDAAQALDQISLGQQHSAVGAKVRFDLDLPAQAVDDLPLHEGILLPEWHYRKEAFLLDHCRLVPMLSRDAREQSIPEHLRGLVRQVRHQFKQWRSEPLRQHRQLDGNEIDIQAWVEQTSQPTHDSAMAVYTDRPKVRKSRSTLLLADVSQSTESYVNNRPIIDGIRDALLVFAEGLDAINEPFSLYAFSSIRRRQVRFHLLKNAREPWSDLTRGRVLALKPGYYTRMGAAIRQSTTVLLDAEQEQRWLLILTDGKPNDVDHYEHRYGIEDTRKAVLEAKEKGIQVFAITLDPEADEYAPHLFGRENYHLVTRNENLVELLPRLFRQLSV